MQVPSEGSCHVSTAAPYYACTNDWTNTIPFDVAHYLADTHTDNGANAVSEIVL